MKKLINLLANLMVYSGHYLSKLSAAMIDKGINLHIKHQTEVGIGLEKVKSIIDSAMKAGMSDVAASFKPEKDGRKPEAGNGYYVTSKKNKLDN